MRSLTRTLILGTTLATAVILLVAGILLYVLARASLLAQFDRSLLDKARLLASTVETEGGKLDLEFEEFDMAEFEGDRPPAYLQLWRQDGSILHRSKALGAGSLRPLDGQAKAPLFQEIKLPDGRDGRAVTITFSPRREGEARSLLPNSSAQTVTLALARDRAPIDTTLFRLAMLLLPVGVGAVVCATVILWWVVRRSLRPLEQLAAEIRQLDEKDLDKSIDAGAGPEEIRPVIRRLNELLRRLDAAFRRERSFSADVAHELRNPLAGLVLKMDVTTSKPRTPQEYQEALVACRGIAGQMQTMVENLLSLARLETGQYEIRPEPVLLDDLIRQSWGPLKGTAGRRALEVKWALEQDLTLITDSSQLGVIIHNVLENAVAYADQGGLVEIGTKSCDGRATISVANSGSRLSQSEAEQAFGRFWRGDAARTDPAVHCGLGLSLVKKVATALGGTVSVRSRKGGTFEIAVSVPSQADAPRG